MKKHLLRMILVGLAILSLAVAPAIADWSITLTWTHSNGPDLASEAVLYDGVEKSSVLASDLATVSFIVPDLGGSVVVRSFNSQGAYAETEPIIVNTQPTPANGVNVHVTYVAP